MQEKSVRISKEVYEVIKDLAKKEERTITCIIRRAINKYLTKPKS